MVSWCLAPFSEHQVRATWAEWLECQRLREYCPVPVARMLMTLFEREHREIANFGCAVRYFWVKKLLGVS